MHNHNKAFTLVELSIVIVVIGLIVSGVVAGQNLVKAAKINSQISQLQQYDAAFQTFRITYGMSPGDLNNATSYWQSDATVLNGNGNGMINDLGNRGCINDDVGGSNCTFDGEKLQFFRHLSKAGMIKEQYNGSTTLGLGYPKLAYDSRYGFFAGSYYRPAGSTFGMVTTNAKVSIVGPYVYLALVVGNPGASGSMWGFSNPSIFIPKDLYTIDKKLDDGLYDNGKLLSYSVTTANCVASGNYNFSSTTADCVAMYKLK